MHQISYHRTLKVNHTGRWYAVRNCACDEACMNVHDPWMDCMHNHVRITYSTPSTPHTQRVTRIPETAQHRDRSKKIDETGGFKIFSGKG